MPETDVKYKIIAQGDDDAEILIYDVIGSSWFEETVTAKQFVKDLKDIGPKRNLNVRINSPGGSVWDGTAIYNALKSHKGNVTVNIEGIAASMASVIAMAGDTVNMAETAMMMIHNPAGLVMGESKDMRKAADLLDKSKEQLVKAYTQKSGKSAEEIAHLMDEETWFTADEAFEAGLVDAVTESPGQLVASFDLSVLSASGVKVPRHVESKLAALFSTPSPKKEPTMSADKPDRIPATVQELKAMEGADNEFVVEQLTAGATVQDAIVALNKRLLNQLQERATKLETLENEVKQAKEQSPPASEAGVAPVNSSEHAREGGETQQKPWGNDALGFYRKELTKLMAEGKSATAASQLINRRNPGLVEAMQVSG